MEPKWTISVSGRLAKEKKLRSSPTKSEDHDILKIEDYGLK
jgi:hypothetical protein